ncbi:VOC family protein [Psychromonas sp. KJ10-2]|uniref:VOC family protein n=1 Tax=Psychromonas sp. KJ10-2 TaxID=3391822 RepID=UPI0039B37119
MCATSSEKSIESGKTTIGTSGIHHLGLTIPDIKKTAAFFIEQLNFKVVGEKPAYPAIFVSDGTVMLTLWQIKDADNLTEFDRTKNVGLHHFALKVNSIEQLQTLYQNLLKLDDVDIEFAPEALGDSPFVHMMCSIPVALDLN